MNLTLILISIIIEFNFNLIPIILKVSIFNLVLKFCLNLTNDFFFYLPKNPLIFP